MSCGVNQHVQIGPNQIYSFWEKKNYFHSYNVGFYVKTLSCGEDYLGFLIDTKNTHSVLIHVTILVSEKKFSFCEYGLNVKTLSCIGTHLEFLIDKSFEKVFEISVNQKISPNSHVEFLNETK